MMPVIIKKTTTGKEKLRINRISIRNYKGIDELDLDFTPPRMPHDPDVTVIGSRNGVGKTSVLECCALLLLSLMSNFGENALNRMERLSPIDFPDLLIRAGYDCAEVSGDIDYDGENLNKIGISINRNGNISKLHKQETKGHSLNRNIFELVKSVCGFTANPVVENLFLLFHSYRKVQEGNLELGMMVDTEKRTLRVPYQRNYDSPLSAFKLRILRSLMGKADLFEMVDGKDPATVICKLDKLVEIYAGGKIGKLRPSLDNTVDFRINPINNKGESFSFDGLSSGQKEIISTLFLIWYHTKDKPSVVFIDEPELHLNAEWHGRFVRELTKIAPQNQYIMATHSEDIADSVEKYQRLIITR